jgi:hypothetical protein
VKLNQGTGNAAQVSYLQTSQKFWTPPSAAYRFLYEVDIQPTLSTLNSRQWNIGLDPGTVEFYSDYTLANWQARTGGAGVDTGVAVNVGAAWVHLAFLIDTTLATPAVIYFINGTQVATRTVSLPSAGTNYVLSFGGAQLTTGTCAFTVGDLSVVSSKF